MEKVCDQSLKAMAPKKAMKAPASPKKVFKGKATAKGKAGAKCKAKAKTFAVKQEPASPSQVNQTGDVALVTQKDQQLFNTFLNRNADDPKVQSLRHQYQSLARNDGKKRELISQWKLDRSLSWHVVQEDNHQTGRTQELSGSVGWVTKWQLSDLLKIPVQDPLFTEMLQSLECSSEQWDLSKPQEAFLAKKGELKYWLHSMDQFCNLKDWQQDSESVSKSRSGVLKVKPAAAQPALMSQYPLSDQVNNTVTEIQGVDDKCKVMLKKLEDGIERCEKEKTGGEEKFKQVRAKATEALENILKSCSDLVQVKPSDVSEDHVKKSKELLSESKVHKEGLQKTLGKVKVLLDQ